MLQALTDEYNASQDKVRVTLQNQGGYEGDDRQVRAEQPERPPESRASCRSTWCSRWLTAGP